MGNRPHTRAKGRAAFSNFELRRAFKNVAHEPHQVEDAHSAKRRVAAFEHGMSVAVIGITLILGIAVDGGKIERAVCVPTLVPRIVHKGRRVHEVLMVMEVNCADAVTVGSHRNFIRADSSGSPLATARQLHPPRIVVIGDR